VHEFIGELAEQGLAVILVSSELPEIMGLADRVLVMKEGRIVSAFNRGSWSAEAIVSAATGARDAA
jgi:rhamnose transport system ATP-binding protein